MFDQKTGDIEPNTAGEIFQRIVVKSESVCMTVNPSLIPLQLDVAELDATFLPGDVGHLDRF